MSAIQSFTYKIHSYHTNASGRLFVHQLFNFLQDAAHRHADGFGFGQKQLVDQDLFWVLSRLTLEISSLPQQGEEITVSTWVKSLRGSISEREFSITCSDNVLINASSLWFCIVGKTHKPTRVPVEYGRLMLARDVYATTNGSEKVELLGTDAIKSKGLIVNAYYSDIDMADHVNNATYARWLMDELDTNYLQNKLIKKLVINYLDECFLGDDIKVYHILNSNASLTHEVVSLSSNNIICRANSIWH